MVKTNIAIDMSPFFWETISMTMFNSYFDTLPESKVNLFLGWASKYQQSSPACCWLRLTPSRQFFSTSPLASSEAVISSHLVRNWSHPQWCCFYPKFGCCDPSVLFLKFQCLLVSFLPFQKGQISFFSLDDRAMELLSSNMATENPSCIDDFPKPLNL